MPNKRNLVLEVDLLLSNTVTLESSSAYNISQGSKAVVEFLVPRARAFNKAELDQIEEDILLLDADMKPTGTVIGYSKAWNVWSDDYTNHASSDELLENHSALYFVPLSELNFR